MSVRSRQRRDSHRGLLEVVAVAGNEHVSSIEPESLQVLTYCKLARVPVEVHTACLPWKSPSWKFPVLRHGSRKVVSKSSEDIISYLKDYGFNLDCSLKEPALAEITAYSAMLTDRLLPALLYSRWMDSQNYLDVTRLQYGEMLQFPLSTFYLSWRHRRAQRALMRGAPPDTTLEQQGTELLVRAEECISLLSSRLGDKQYFNGDSPSSLDALVFGYLEVVLQGPLPSTNSLHRHLLTCPNLLQHCGRLRAKAFPDKKLRSFSIASPAQPVSLWRDPKVWLSVGVASLLLCVQAVRVGLLPPALALLWSRRAAHRPQATAD